MKFGPVVLWIIAPQGLMLSDSVNNISTTKIGNSGITKIGTRMLLPKLIMFSTDHG